MCHEAIEGLIAPDGLQSEYLVLRPGLVLCQWFHVGDRASQNPFVHLGALVTDKGSVVDRNVADCFRFVLAICTDFIFFELDQALHCEFMLCGSFHSFFTNFIFS